MVLHYIEKHDYRPDLTFMNRVMRDWALPSRNPCRENSCGIDIEERSRRFRIEHEIWVKEHNERIDKIQKGEIEEDLNIDKVVARIWNECGGRGSTDEAAEGIASCIAEKRSGFMSSKEVWLSWFRRLVEDDQLLERLAQKPCYSKEQWLQVMKKLTRDLLASQYFMQLE
jgi:hypothetical protein